MRLGYALHKARGFERFVPRDEMLRIATANGLFAITGSEAGSTIAPGVFADLMVIDWQDLASELIDPETDPLNLLLARGTKRHLRQMFVNGREVVRAGQVTGVDLVSQEAELLAQMRAAWPNSADLRAAMPELGAALAGHHAQGLHGCC
jgi:cytosine/adenosine deaminase-related metal-dependent hydrolase